MSRITAKHRTFAAAVVLILMSAANTRVLAQPLGAQQCRALPDPQARLLCYDAWVDGQAATVSASKSAAVPALAAATVAAPSAGFGLEQQTGKSEAQEIVSEIAGLFEGWGPKQVIKLANGQLWQIVDGSSAVLYLQNPKVKVRRGMLGSFVLEFEASNASARVRRLER